MHTRKSLYSTATPCYCAVDESQRVAAEIRNYAMRVAYERVTLWGEFPGWQKSRLDWRSAKLPDH